MSIQNIVIRGKSMIIGGVTYDSTDCKLALEAATTMATRFRQDFCIMPDLSIKPLRGNPEVPLEIIRYSVQRGAFVDG